MPILVTAFGPFGGRSENASSLVLGELKKSLPGIRTRVLPVDAVLAPARLRRAIRRIQPSALIMLGENAACHEIRLETMSWNLKDFAIPDIAGRKPAGISIRRGAADSIPATLPMAEIRNLLDSMGGPVSLSNDPGRYLCNLLSFTALDFLEKNKIGIPAGFIHLPLESVLPTSSAVGAIAAVIRLLHVSAEG